MRTTTLPHMKNAVVCLLLLLCTTAVQAQFRCNVEGKTVYQQMPCAGGRQVNTSGAGQSDPSSAGSQQAQREVAWARRQALVDVAVANGEVFVGMTGGEAVKAWGTPHKINRTVNGSGSREQWIYRRQGIGWDQYVYVDNGLVSAVQTAR